MSLVGDLPQAGKKTPPAKPARRKSQRGAVLPTSRSVRSNVLSTAALSHVEELCRLFENLCTVISSPEFEVVCIGFFAVKHQKK